MTRSISANPSSFPDFATFGELLRFLRRRARMTQTELSIAVGYSTSQISRLEQNERFPDDASLLAIFVPALGLEKEPDTVKKLLELAHAARGEKQADEPPGSSAPEHLSPEHLPSKHSPPEHLPNTATRRSEPTTLDAPPLHNLPLRLTSFIGREEERTRLRQQVLRSRIVTLTGVGGVGKTSLAIESARSLPFKDGVWLVELAAIQEANLVPQLLINLFNLPELAGRTSIEALITYLQHKQLLLLLDNCEHLITACADLVDRLVRTCPQLHVLATSREMLNLDGEVEWPVSPLQTPAVFLHPQKHLSASAITAYEAIALFLERTQVSKPDFRLTDQNAQTIAKICSQLEGIPLAIELATARLKGLTLEQIADRLHDRFALLSAGRRTALPRHQTLQAAIDWSYDLLTEPEKVLFRRLAIFTSGWTLEAAESIAEDKQGKEQTLSLLLQLVNKSLVVVDEQVDEAANETRYRMLEMLRQYGVEKLREAHEEESVHQRHFAYFLSLAEQSHAPTLIGPKLATWLNRIAVEQGNLRTAYLWARHQEEGSERLLRLSGALGMFWIFRAGYDQGITWLEDALSRAEDAPPVLLGIVLSRLADLLMYVGRFKPELLEIAQNLFIQSNHKEGIAYCLAVKVGSMIGDPALRTQAITYHKESLQLFREVGHLLFTGFMLSNLAGVLQMNGQQAEAAALYEESLELGRKHNELSLRFNSLVGFATIDRQRAIALCREELTRHYEQGAEEAQAMVLGVLGHHLGEEKQYTEAISHLLECLALWRKLGIKFSRNGGIARATYHLGRTYFWAQDDQTASHYLQEALQLYAEVGDVHGIATVQMILGHIALWQKEIEQAADYFYATLKHSSDSSMGYLPLALLGVAQVKRALGDLVFAGRIFGASTSYEERLYLIGISEQELFLNLLANARSLLSDPAFAAAWAQGQAMSIEQAVAYALGQFGNSYGKI